MRGQSNVDYSGSRLYDRGASAAAHQGMVERQRNGMRTGVFVFLAIMVFRSVSAAATPDPHEFPRPAALEPQIRFWRAIFTEHSTHQVVLHDAFYLDKVYKVLDFRREAAGMDPVELERLKREVTDLELERLRQTLLRLHELGPNPQGLDAETAAIYTLLADDRSPNRFLEAAGPKRLHSQRGLRERFAEGLRESRRWLPEMERVFREAGLPVELTRLPLIESCFNVQAYSKAGAAGIWQFIPATGRRFLRIDGLVDERRDPLASTRAAARYFAILYDELGSWPLAITSYNHGPVGISRAVDEVGSRDIATIIRNYDGNAFGFASRNFYAEFLAALDVEGDHRTYFGDMQFPAPLQVREHRLDRPVGIQVAAKIAGVDRDELADLNPALSDGVVSGRQLIPTGYRLRLPAHADDFATRLASVPVPPAATRRSSTRPSKKVAKSRPKTLLTHRVRKGETLSHIARRHRVSVERLLAANGMTRATQLRSGQILRVPSST
jgi:membrane-bound lytic murein transglycosylase D